MIHTTRELEEIQKNFIEMEVKSFAREVIEFIDESPSTYHVVLARTGSSLQGFRLLRQSSLQLFATIYLHYHNS